MKWNDIKNRFEKHPTTIDTPPVVDTVRAVTGNPLLHHGMAERQKKMILIVSIFAIIIGAGTTLFFIIKANKNDPYNLSKREWQFIDAFLAQNPAPVLTTEQQQFAQAVISQPVTISSEEQQVIDHILQGR